MNAARRLSCVVLAASAALALARPDAAQTKKVPQAAPAPTPLAQPAVPSANPPDIAYGEFQRGHYITALNEAAKRAQANDPVAMTLLGELYANGLGVARDDSKAAQWYKLAASNGDRNAMFALAMFDFEGRAGPRNDAEAARLLAAAAKLGHAAAAYDLGLLYLQGKQFPQDFQHAAELFRQSADAGNPDAQYALATMYEQGQGVAKDRREAMRLMLAAAIGDNLDAMVEFAIAQFNGDGTDKNESSAAGILLKAAKRGSAIAQDRMARILMAGRGVLANPTEAIKWHLIAKAAGDNDPELDAFAAKQPPAVREAADKAARTWLSTAMALRP